MNRFIHKGRVHNQGGAAMVEAALTIVLFLILIFGILEFAMLIFKASSLAEATRAGVRYLIVNDPVMDLAEIDCGDAESNFAVGSCGGAADCTGLFTVMQKQYESLEEDQVHVQYRCSSTGFAEAGFNIYEVEVSVQGAEYRFVTPGILGLNTTVTLPDFATTRLSEDLHTISQE